VSILAIITVLIESLVIAALVMWYIILPYVAAYQTAKHIAQVKEAREAEMQQFPPIMRQIVNEFGHPVAGSLNSQAPADVIKYDPRIEDHHAGTN